MIIDERGWRPPTGLRNHQGGSIGPDVAFARVQRQRKRTGTAEGARSDTVFGTCYARPVIPAPQHIAPPKPPFDVNAAAAVHQRGAAHERPRQDRLLRSCPAVSMHQTPFERHRDIH